MATKAIFLENWFYIAGKIDFVSGRCWQLREVNLAPDCPQTANEQQQAQTNWTERQSVVQWEFQ